MGVPYSGLPWDPPELGQVSTSSGFSHWGMEGWAQSQASETLDKLRPHDLIETGSTTPSLWLQGSVCFCWQRCLVNWNSSSRHLALSSGLCGHCTHMTHRHTSRQNMPKGFRLCECSWGSASPCPLLWPLGLCPEAPCDPSAPVGEAKGRLQCAQLIF